MIMKNQKMKMIQGHIRQGAKLIHSVEKVDAIYSIMFSVCNTDLGITS